MLRPPAAAPQLPGRYRQHVSLMPIMQLYDKLSTGCRKVNGIDDNRA